MPKARLASPVIPSIPRVSISCGVRQVSGPLEQRSEQEVFYSCPSTSAEAFFEAVSSQLAGLETSAYADTPGTQLEQALEIAQAVQANIPAIIAFASHQTDTPSLCFGIAAAGPTDQCMLNLSDVCLRIIWSGLKPYSDIRLCALATLTFASVHAHSWQLLGHICSTHPMLLSQPLHVPV